MPNVIQVPARSLRAGDHLSATGRTVLRVVRDGLYQRTPADVWYPDRRRFPAGHVEIVLDDGLGVRYWRAATSIGVAR